MNRVQIEDRLDLIIDVYVFTRNTNFLTAGQRICLTMERVALMRCLDLIKENPFRLATPKYTLPAELDLKVKFLYKKAKSI